MKEMIETIAQALVDQPGLVFVKEVGGMHTSTLEVTVAKAGIGKVTGKQGRTVGALRALLNAVSAKTKKTRCARGGGIIKVSWHCREVSQ